MKRCLLHVAVIAAALVLAGSALAAKPPAYSGTGGQVQGQVQKGAVAGVKTVGQLPFTGTDLALFSGIALALVVAGISVRRAARKRP